MCVCMSTPPHTHTQHSYRLPFDGVKTIVLLNAIVSDNISHPASIDFTDSIDVTKVLLTEMKFEVI